MTRYIDADKMKFNETVGYTKSQPKVDSLTAKLNEVVHIKINRLIDDTPTADVVPVIHAHYIYNDFDNYECSNCHVHCPVDHLCTIYNTYCPHCGAKMDEVEQ